MKRLLILALLLSLASLKVFSAGAGSHGGDVVICFGGNEPVKTTDYARELLISGKNPFDQNLIKKIDTIRLFDYWEYDIAIRKYSTSEEALEGILKNISNAPYYREFIKNTALELRLRSYRSLPILRDEGLIPNMPLNCLIVQTAIQKENSLVLVDQTLFELLTPFDQAGLLIHEALIRVGDNEKHENDTSLIRLTNAFIAQDKMRTHEEIHQEFENNFLKLVVFRNLQVGSSNQRLVLIKNNNFYFTENSFQLDKYIEVLPVDEISIGEYFMSEENFVKIKLKTKRTLFLDSNQQVDLPKDTTLEFKTFNFTHFDIQDVTKNSGYFQYGEMPIKKLYWYGSNDSLKVVLGADYATKDFKIKSGYQVSLSKTGLIDDELHDYEIVITRQVNPKCSVFIIKNSELVGCKNRKYRRVKL